MLFLLLFVEVVNVAFNFLSEIADANYYNYYALTGT
jgi:hypothetical protein